MATMICGAPAAVPRARGGARVAPVATPGAAGLIHSRANSNKNQHANNNNDKPSCRPKCRRRGVFLLAAAASSSSSPSEDDSPSISPVPSPSDGNLVPEARDYTGELRMPPPVVEVPTELPAMLFPSGEMLLPGCTQVLHLYEARFLALLDEVTTSTGGLFAHVTFLPSDEADGGLRVNQVATLVRVEEVQREEIGAKVTIIGESRLTLRDIKESQPYITAGDGGKDGYLLIWAGIGG